MSKPFHDPLSDVVRTGPEKSLDKRRGEGITPLSPPKGGRSRGPRQRDQLTDLEKSERSRSRFFSWVRWAEANVPDQDAHLAASSAQMLDHLGRTVTADAVRDRLRAQGRAK